jgi:hypothetical protein
MGEQTAQTCAMAWLQQLPERDQHTRNLIRRHMLLSSDCGSFGTLHSGRSNRFPSSSKGVARFGGMYSRRSSNRDCRAFLGRCTIWVWTGPRGIAAGLVGRRHPRRRSRTAGGSSDLLCHSAWPSFLERMGDSSRRHVYHCNCYVHVPECHDPSLHTSSDNNCRSSYAIQLGLPARCCKIAITLICLPRGDLSEMAWLRQSSPLVADAHR